jgi:hypothetical protein
MSADVIVDGDYYAVVPEWLLTAEFTSNAVKLYAILRRYADKSTRMAHPSRKTLSEKMGFARSASVDVAIKELVDKGAMETFIRWRHDENGKPTGERTSNGYKLFTKRETPGGVAPESALPHTQERIGVVPETVEGVVPQSVGGVVPETVQQNHSHFEPQSEEPHKAPAMPATIKRASQISPDFEPTAEMLKWAKAETPLVDAVFDTQQFIDHHLAKGSLMKDWNRAWQTWMRNSQKWTAQKNPQAGGGYNPNDWMNQ